MARLLRDARGCWLMPKPCQFPSDNHSEDRFTVWHGSTTPLILCGFHERYFLQEAFALKREGAINANDTKQV